MATAKPPNITPQSVIFLDGYNVIMRLYGRGMPAERAREELHRRLLMFLGRRKAAITVVYDGNSGVTGTVDRRLAPLKIIFTFPPESADDWIIASCRKAVAAGKDAEDIKVVTDDVTDIWSALRPEGITLIHCESFWSLMEQAMPKLRKSEEMPAGSYPHVSKKEISELEAAFIAPSPGSVVKEDSGFGIRDSEDSRVEEPKDSPTPPQAHGSQKVLSGPSARPDIGKHRVPVPTPAAVKAPVARPVPPPPPVRPKKPGGLPDPRDLEGWETLFKEAPSSPTPPPPKLVPANGPALKPSGPPPVRSQAKTGEPLSESEIDAWEQVFSAHPPLPPSQGAPSPVKKKPSPASAQKKLRLPDATDLAAWEELFKD